MAVFSRLANYFQPVLFLSLGGYYTALTALRLLFTSPRALTNLRDRAFAATWQSLGPMSAEKDLPFVPPVVSQAYGVVVDIGPGGGFNVKHFDKDKCSKIYGVEPNEGLHEQLREEVKKAGLEGIYEVVGAGIEETDKLASYGITENSLNSVVCVKVLCGVPTPELIAQKIYSWLKPGGQLLIYEHVVNKKDPITKPLQRFFNFFWPTLMGGCEICRDTESILRSVGEWDGELKFRKEQEQFEILPFVEGRLVKKEDGVLVG